MPLVNGTLTDFGLDPLLYESPALLFRASSTGLAGLNILSARKAVEVVPAANGFFEVDLVSTTLIAPETTHYTVEIRYRDQDTRMMVSELLPWKLLVPPEGGALGDLLRVPANPGLVWTGTQPPILASAGTWWIDPDTGDLSEFDGQGWAYKANLRGPTGYNATGAAEDAQALADFVNQSSGPNPFAAALGEQFATPAEATAAATAAAASKLDAVDQGQRLMAKLDNGQGDAVLAVTTDSTGYDNTAWVRKLADHFAAKHPALRVLYRRWSDSSKALVDTTVQAGTPNTELSTMIDDRFDRTAADIKGTAPTLGLSAWEYQSGADNWDVTGTAAKATAGSGYGKVLISSGQGGQTYTKYTYKAVAVPATTAQMRFYVKSGLFFSDSIVELRLIRGASTWTATINKTINGVGAQIATTGNTAIPADGIYAIEIHYKPGPGAAVTATINGVTLTAAITDADDAILAPYTRHGFGAISADTVGDEIRLFQVRAPEAATLQTLTILNGTMPGANLAYHTTWFTSMFPTAPDLMIVAMGHNYNGVTVADFMPIFQAYIDKVRTAFPKAGLIVSSQNPEASPRPVTGRTLHAARNLELRAYADAMKFGYIPVFEEFTRRRAEWSALIQADGVHLTHGPGEGDDVWAAVSNSHFDSLSYLP